MNPSKTTKSITLVLISSALVFLGWGTPGCVAHRPYNPVPVGGATGYYGGGTNFWWFHYSSGRSYSSGSSTSFNHSSPGSSKGSGSVSGRGGFGSSGIGVGA